MNDQQALHHATPSGRGVHKIRGPQPLALGACYFRNTQPSGVTLHKEPLVPGSLKEFYLGSFHTNYIYLEMLKSSKK